MCMYASAEGFASDFHLVHLGRFALGGAGLVIAEATAITAQGRISHHDLGIWDDAHVPGLRKITDFIRTQGSVPGIQLAHAGRRASVREPWREGAPLTSEDADAGSAPWSTVAPSPLPAGPDWPVPVELDDAGIIRSIREWGEAARRAVDAGFDVVELHGAHGYLLHSFLSPISNQRTDRWGGDAERRMRYPLEVIAAVREAIGDRALLYRISAVDGAVDGLDIAQTALIARRLRDAGVDLIDVSSGGITTDRSLDLRVRRGFAFHADFSRAMRDAGAAPVATVGLVIDPAQASALVSGGDADLILLGREMLDDPNWAQHARRALGVDEFTTWDIRHGSAIVPRLRTLERLRADGEHPFDRFSDRSASTPS